MKASAKRNTPAAGLLLVGLAALTPQARADGGAPLWTNRYDGPSPIYSIEHVHAVAVDSSGNVFVTGDSYGIDANGIGATLAYSSAGVPLWTNRSGGTALAVDASGNVFVTGGATIKYSSSGGPLWTNYQDGAIAIALDSSGNVFVTGSSGPNSGDVDIRTSAYSNMGVPLWTNRYRYNALGFNQDNARAIAVDSSGNVFVTGYSSAPNDGKYDYVTLAYSNAGLPLWTNRYNGSATNGAIATALAVDRSGSVFVTGSSYGSGPFLDYATIKYSGSGLPLWTNSYNGTGNGADQAHAIAVDNEGNVFVTGGSNGDVNAQDFATVAYSSDGVPLWTNRFDSSDGSIAAAIAEDSTGNVFVTGSLSGDALSGPSYATVAYSNGGIALWTNLYNGGNGGGYVTALAVDRSGNVIVTGDSGDTKGYYDYATIKYSSSVAPRLEIQRISNQLVLRWTNSDFSLQSAPVITGAFTNIPGATSPHTNTITGPQQYFRLKAN